MKRTVILFVLLCLSISGCATISEKTFKNRDGLMRLSVGMSKKSAIGVMGTKPMHVYSNSTGYDLLYKGLKINNPYRSEIINSAEGTLEVAYYVTDVKRDDGAITDDELTPLVFRGDKLIGWGWRFLQDTARNHQVIVK